MSHKLFSKSVYLQPDTQADHDRLVDDARPSGWNIFFKKNLLNSKLKSDSADFLNNFKLFISLPTRCSFPSVCAHDGSTGPDRVGVERVPLRVWLQTVNVIPTTEMLHLSWHFEFNLGYLNFFKSANKF